MKKFYLLFFVGLFIISSCTMEKRQYMPGRNIEWLSLFSAKIKKNKDNAKIEKILAKEERVNDIVENPHYLDPIKNSQNLIASNEESLLLNNFKESNSITLTEISNKSKNANENSIINYYKENKQINKNFNDKKFQLMKRSDDPKGGGFGIASFVISIVGLIIAGIIFGAIAIIFGAIGMINRKLKGLAIAGLVIGIIDVVAAIILLLA